MAAGNRARSTAEAAAAARSAGPASPKERLERPPGKARAVRSEFDRDGGPEEAWLEWQGVLDPPELA